MQYTNSQILSAVLNRFLQPAINQLAVGKMESFSVVQAINNKIRSTGFVSPNYSIVKEIYPFIEPVTGAVSIPVLNRFISQIPDDTIPNMAHSIVDKAIQEGKLSLMEGYVELEGEDLKELKRLLNLNLPAAKVEEYQVITEEPTKTKE